MSQGQQSAEQLQPGAPSKRKMPPNAGIGRKKGVPNKATGDVRTLIAKIAEKNAPKIDAWLSRVARKNPAKAIDLYIRMIEYHIPKLSRQEIVKPPADSGRVIDSSQLTTEQREQLRQMILAQEPAAIEHQAPNVLEPVGLAVAQVIDSVETDGSTSDDSL